MARLRLDDAQRAELESLMDEGEDRLVQRRARILLLADGVGGPGLGVDEIAERLGIGRALVENTCRRLEQKGIDAALKRRREEALALPPLVTMLEGGGMGLTLSAGDHGVEARIRWGAREKTVRLSAGAVETCGLEDLPAGRRIEYEVEATSGGRTTVYSGSVVARRPVGESFRFALLADVHLPAFVLEHWLDGQGGPMAALMRFGRARSQVASVFRRVLESIHELRPDFVISLGDLLHLATDSPNPRFPAPDFEKAYADVRSLMSAVTAHSAFLNVLGNWEGESGWIDETVRRQAREARVKALPQPENRSYFSWTWGDALFVVLDVTGFTAEAPRLDEPGEHDWTLGHEQLRWLEHTLEQSRQPMKLLLMHHAVAGNGGDARSTAYARGGGRAARVGEQARVHELAIRHGAQAIFLGHDHVFADMEVDGMHYTLPGSAGAPWKFTSEATGYETFDRRSGFATVEVGPDFLRVEWRDVNGEVFGGYDLPRRETAHES